MLLHPDKSDFILSMIERLKHMNLEVIVHSLKRVTPTIWEAQDYFIHLVFQARDISR